MNLENIGNNLATRDNLLAQIETEITRKKKFLVDKAGELEKTSQLNSFLKEVQKDYQKYSNAILDEKGKQMRAMEALSAYVSNVKNSETVLMGHVDEATRDQENIMDEINKIRANLDKLV